MMNLFNLSASKLTWRGMIMATAAVLLLLIPQIAQARVDVCYSGGPLLPNFKLNGNAQLDGSNLIVTRASSNQRSSLAYNSPLSTSGDVSIKMKIRIWDNKSGGADGMAFVMHNDPAGTAALGLAGGGVGYQGITKSVIVEFDTYNNGSGDRNSSNHIAISRNGSANCASGAADCLGYLDLGTLGIDLKSEAAVYIWIDYLAATKNLRVFVSTTDSKPGTPNLSATVDVPATVGPQMYLTFTGSTGGSQSQHEIQELFASDGGSDPANACCSTATDCAASPLGPVCDPVKKSCGPCSLQDVTGCGAGLEACDLSQGTNECTEPCDGDNGSGTATACGSGFFPSCSDGGSTTGSCVTCDGDFSQAGATQACPGGAPTCLDSGFCGRCTSNDDCSSGSNRGDVCNIATGVCRACVNDGECGSGEYCDAAGKCMEQVQSGGTLPSGSQCPDDATQICQSSECNVDTQTCSDPNGLGCTGPADCTTNICAQDGECGCSLNSECANDEFCSAAFRECLDKLSAGAPIPNDALHDGTCSESNAEAVCLSALCNAVASTCALANAQSCSATNQCVSNTCTSGHCVPDSNGCWVDANCSEDNFCDRSELLCSGKLAAGSAIPNDGLHDGTCSVFNAEAACLTGLCNSDQNTCGSADGSGCALGAECVSDQCTSSHCVPPSAGCWFDSDCSEGNYCDRSVLMCTTQLQNGANLPNDGLHDGTCTEALADATCASGECNTTSNTCSQGFGLTCSDANECTSNTCTGGHCVPDQNGCWENTDCGLNEYCDRANLTCESLLEAGETIPNDGLHDGTCTEANAIAVCASGLCNATENTCADNQGSGCDSSSDCVSNTCSSSHCVPNDTGCWLDADCSENQYCDRANLLCVAQLAAGTPIPNNGLHDGTCSQQNASAVCESGSCNPEANTCAGDGGADCTTAVECSTNACTSAHCVTSDDGCWLDSDCDTNSYCDRAALACTAKRIAGESVPSDGLHDGSCSQENATAVCVSGLCNDSTDTCASDNGSTCDDSNQCLSNTCTSGACVPDTNGCNVDTDCGSTSYCDRSQLVCQGRLPSGTALPGDGLHSGVCNDADAAAVCMSGLCNTEANTCANEGAETCTDDAQCVSGSCTSGHCVADEGGCWLDTDCSGNSYCDRALLTCRVKLGSGETVPEDGLHSGGCTQENANAVCSSGLCNDSTNTCADESGTECEDAQECVTNTCTSGFCVPSDDGCWLDSDCGSTSFCDRSQMVCVGNLAPGSKLPTDDLHDGVCDNDASTLCQSGVCSSETNRCVSPNGDGCDKDDECLAEACGANGRCGLADGESGCTKKNEFEICQSETCSDSGVCLAPEQCAVDSDCSDGDYCSKDTCHSPRSNGTKLGEKCDAQSAERICDSGLCNSTTDTCGAPNNSACEDAADCASNVCEENQCVDEPAVEATNSSAGLSGGGGCSYSDQGPAEPGQALLWFLSLAGLGFSQRRRIRENAA